MQYRILGRTGIRVSVISFGAGPVSGLITGDDFDAQRAVIEAAIKAGINWFDTAPGYGQGQSESNLGRVLSELRSTKSQSSELSEPLHIATKVRLPVDSSEPTWDIVRRSVEESLQRLRVGKVTLLQLHNGITNCRGDEPASLTPADILQRGGVVDAFHRLRDEGLADFIGLTGTGHPDALREVIRSGEFDTVQTPYNILNPSAGDSSTSADGETDYGNIIANCAAMKMGVFAIRVFAAGALLGQTPSAHTLKTPYFPLPLYQRDTERAARLRETLSTRITMPELAVRFALTHPHITSAIIGFGSTTHVAEVAGLPLTELSDKTSALWPVSDRAT